MLSFYRNKGFWIGSALVLPVLLVVGNYGYKIMTSVYNTDFGNGLVIYADDYVRSGKWVFDCSYSRLISREPLPVPLLELSRAKDISFSTNLSSSNKGDTTLAKEVINAVTSTPGWYNGLRYLYSGLDENSDLTFHSYDMVTQYQAQPWAIRVGQDIEFDGTSSFNINAFPYDPATYVDYAKAMEEAASSCSVPQ
ncbi:hypothetical protein WH50_01600 [Pokkaliibacter plantistimulans]|uniref:Uncharacterized protein n=1 Tax=Pokkaliibacter plantistimulans TaxID=1635171 RepID=A0ABX5M1S1_9GAMM|nr:hypothetical protein [Pokkaliibacter plantistimulans]PXF32877.1 hypothetical protein WH50_01600 [Pokkaliibacter plantistimulans]